MPDLNCLNEEVTQIKMTVHGHAARLDSLTSKLDTNTALTEGIKSDTQEIVELMKWGKTTRKVIFWLGSTIGAIWALIEGARHFK